MYWNSGKWFLSCQTSRYDPSRIRYIVLVKQSPFKNGHPSLEPDLVGICISADMNDVKDLAADFIRSAEEHGIAPASPYTRASAANMPGSDRVQSASQREQAQHFSFFRTL